MTQATAYGKELWLMLAPTFDAATALDGFGTSTEKAQAYTGFIAAACGAMFADSGREATMAVLAAISQQIQKMHEPAGAMH